MDARQRDALVNTLVSGAASLREARLPGELAAELERLAAQVDQPCVLAVVGRMKAGKSTFINALLGADVARVGQTETTATINYLSYGTPPDPARPIRCYWRGDRDRYEYVSREFLDGLQGTDVEALRRAEKIDRLEYLLPNLYLRDVTLVDTPGTSAVVDEHQNRTAEFLALQKQMRDRQTQETQRIGSGADAVIYLVGEVARSTDQAFLEEFSQAMGGRSRALNAVGVLAKIDLSPEVLARRKELAGKIAEQLSTSLNTVVPVSAGIHRAITQLRENDGRGLNRLMEKIRLIPPRQLEKLLDSDELYEQVENCPVPAEERVELRGDMPWRVFTTIAQLAADPNKVAAAVAEELDEVAGFQPLREVLERHFFKRARFLRWYRVLNDARQVVGGIRFKHLPGLRKRDQKDKATQERFVKFIRAAQANDPVVAKELEELVGLQYGAASRADRVEALVKELDRKLAGLFHDMEEYNADFEALELLLSHPHLFAAGELEELRSLLGQNGLETEKRLGRGQATVAYAGARQQAWSALRLSAREKVRQCVAERAVARYGLILHELTQRS
jgi:hypothetical protein